MTANKTTVLVQAFRAGRKHATYVRKATTLAGFVAAHTMVTKRVAASGETMVVTWTRIED